MDRDKLQNQALELLRSKGRLILNWGTGVGKSRVAVKAMNAILKAVPEARFLLMVQETPHKENWKTEFREALGKEAAEEVLEHTVIDCYASLGKHKHTSWEMIIFDEGHHLRSVKRQEMVKTMSSKRVLVLSATLNDSHDADEMIETLTMTFGEFKSLTYGLQDAIDSNILATPEIHLVPVVLGRDNKEKYESLSDYMDSRSRDYFRLRAEFFLDNEDPDNEDTLELRNKWLSAGARRKRMLGHSKTRVARKILNQQLKDKRKICFCSSIDQITWLGGTNHVSSKNTSKENSEAIADFNEGRQDVLFAMGMLQEGQNLKNIEAGLIIQLDGKSRAFIQKFGRVMRGKKPILYILYAKDTHDEGYLENALKDINEKYISEHEPINDDCTKAEVPVQGRLRLENGDGRIVREQWMIDHNAGRLINTAGEQTMSVRGFLTGVEVINGPRQMYAVNIMEEYASKVHSIYINKKLSLGLLSNLSGVSKPAERPIMINLYKNGAWVQYDVLQGRAKVRWDRKVTEGYPKTDEDKIPYLDGIAQMIDKKCK